jgi:hypothetical protein
MKLADLSPDVALAAVEAAASSTCARCTDYRQACEECQIVLHERPSTAGKRRRIRQARKLAHLRRVSDVQ